MEAGRGARQESLFARERKKGLKITLTDLGTVLRAARHFSEEASEECHMRETSGFS